MADVVLFGGTFDPVHYGHLIVARAVAEHLQAGPVRLAPTGSPPHKPPPIASAQDRLAMLRLATVGESALELCDVEIHRTGPSYTIDTLHELRRCFSSDVRMRWIIGADMLADLPTWRRVDEVLELADMVVVARPSGPADLQAVLDSLQGKISTRNIKMLRQNIVTVPQIDISSTMIRHRLKQGRSIRYLTPPEVVQYIDDKSIYRSKDL